MYKSLLTLSVVVALAACNQEPQPEKLLGKWQGVEGTYMIVRDNDVAIANLDGERVFAAQRSGNIITFTRDGVTETAHPGTGADTGMKWLTDKKDCLVVKSGEGYCRD